jgi:hypothetical protein
VMEDNVSDLSNADHIEESIILILGPDRVIRLLSMSAQSNQKSLLLHYHREMYKNEELRLGGVIQDRLAGFEELPLAPGAVFQRGIAKLAGGEIRSDPGQLGTPASLHFLAEILLDILALERRPRTIVVKAWGFLCAIVRVRLSIVVSNRNFWRF